MNEAATIRGDNDPPKPIECCHRCPLFIRSGPDIGKCGENGKSIVDNATTGDCPRGYFKEPDRLLAEQAERKRKAQAAFDFLAHAIWDFLHRWPWAKMQRAANLAMLAVVRDCLAALTTLKPMGCSCLADWDRLCKNHPPPLDDPAQMPGWTWLIHDQISQKLGKPRFEYESARRKYGWE